ncbi:hypothetical protein GCM10011335_29200 [Aureimonas glaciei]|uniref:Uncharacterized protein n=2 Tax=Aureimonas glaciei TaxID=1776957 RepID=A0A916Y0N0_9HYPH|nr:hypothetical protein GCM10011335_29200 [Aureimonas glaciei]
MAGIVLIFAVNILVFSIVSVQLVPLGDEDSFLRAAAGLLDNWVMEPYPYSDVRPYGYPLFLVLPVWIGRVFQIDPRIPATVVQSAIYVGAAAALSWEISRVNRTFGIAALFGFSANFFAAAYLTHAMSDGLTIGLALWLAVVAVRVLRAPTFSLVLIGALLLGYSVMVRPANLFLIPLWGAALAVSYRKNFGRLVAAGALSAVVFAGILAPQAYHNRYYYGSTNLLTVVDLGTTQQGLGVLALKYYTLLTPPGFPAVTYNPELQVFAQPANVFYQNPLQVGRPLTWPRIDWYFMHPLQGLATVTLHLFGALDQDFIIPYTSDLTPPLRWPISIINHAVLLLSVIGAVKIMQALSVRKRWEVGIVGVAFLLGFCGVYGTAAVESRFGLPVLAFLFPLAFVGAVCVARMTMSGRVAVAISLSLYVVLALCLSEWLQRQAPPIVAQKQMDDAERRRQAD